MLLATKAVVAIVVLLSPAAAVGAIAAPEIVSDPTAVPSRYERPATRKVPAIDWFVAVSTVIRPAAAPIVKLLLGPTAKVSKVSTPLADEAYTGMPPPIL